jgi:hypothetical protein
MPKRLKKRAATNEFLYRIDLFYRLEEVASIGIGSEIHEIGLTREVGAVAPQMARVQEWALGAELVAEGDLVPVVLRVPLALFEEHEGAGDVALDVNEFIEPRDIEVFDGAAWIPVEHWQDMDTDGAVTVTEDGDEVFVDPYPLLPPEARA